MARREKPGRPAQPSLASGPGDARGAVARPALTRALVAWLTAVALLANLLTPVIRAAHADPLDPRHIVALTNESRRQAGLRPVVLDDRLTAAARGKLFDMLKRDYFAHRSPDGRQPWAFMQAAGYRFQAAAENLAKGYDDARDLQRAWMTSHGHRANILNPLFTQIGVADANGIVVVMFGRPAGLRR
jgi:uncharacterized protein YkwD